MARRRRTGLVTPQDLPVDGAGGAFGEDGAENVTVDILREVHPQYRQTYNEWQRLMDLIEGLNLGAYIQKHSRESVEAHAQRKKRVLYRNHLAALIDLICSFLFSKPITREPEPKNKKKGKKAAAPIPFSGESDVNEMSEEGAAPEVAPAELEDEWKHFQYDVDRHGNSIDRFMRRVAYWTQGFGMLDVVVDMPTLTTPPVTRQEEIERRIQPYFTYYFPTARVNWEVDEFGRFLWVRYQEPLTGIGKPFAARDRREIEIAMQQTRNQATPYVATPLRDKNNVAIPRPTHAVYRTFTRTHWYVHTVEENQITDTKSGEHPCGMVPAITFFNRQRALYPQVGLSAVHDIAGIAEAILNLDSLVDEAVYQQVLNILVMRRQMGKKGDIIIGVENVLEYTGEQAPFFITPSTAPLQFMEQRIQDLKEEIARLSPVGQGGDALQVRSVQSGTAQAVEFNETDRILAEKAEELQDGEWKLHWLWYRWRKSAFNGTINYPDTFQVTAFADEVQQLTAASEAVRSDRFRRELEKHLVRRMLPNVPQETLDAIEYEIDIIPASIKSFSGPVFYDPITQEVKNPGDATTPAIGVLGELLGEIAEREQTPIPGAPNTTPDAAVPDPGAAVPDPAQQGQIQKNPRLRVVNRGKKLAAKTKAGDKPAKAA